MVKINIDGAARGNPGPAGYGVYISDSSGDTVEEAYGYIGEQTNNFAEYAALLAALTLANKRGWRSVIIRSDSQLLVHQINGRYKVRNEILAGFFRQAKRLIQALGGCTVEHVPRSENKEADRLANRAVDEMSSDPPDINPIRVKQG